MSSDASNGGSDKVCVDRTEVVRARARIRGSTGPGGAAKNVDPDATVVLELFLGERRFSKLNELRKWSGSAWDGDCVRGEERGLEDG
jgi:hypothetical protein